ncbi:MAG TPA: ATP-binding protein, partial [Desulfobacterales bacterium]|nr:ATP-binding protein [Desulfobacterales bacterium]
FAVYTPGSRAGLPVNVLGSFEPPAAAVREDRDLLRERVQGTATSLLSLAGLDSDATGREHTLVANLLHAAWSGGTGLDLPGLIRAIQDPPFSRVGVMDLDAFFPARERFQLAMRFNNLLAAPGFDAWLEGEPLDVGRLLFTPQGRPRASIFSISHLGDAERMFFVSKLLNEILAWVRTQPGTSSLRALLYMDEIFGYFPPVANPPSKQPLLTLLKQARAFGLGVVLSTQNPVDLDYKGLANTGTWFIGRLQTEGDKNRVMAGLEGAAAGGAFDRSRIEKTISGLGKRVFLMNNVHENEPAIFQTRWTLSYLAGPMTRDHIRRLTQAAPGATAPAPAPAPEAATGPATAAAATAPPMLAPGISAWYLQPEPAGAGVEYHPHVVAGMEIRYTNARLAVDQARRMALAAPLFDGPVALDWDQSFPVDFERTALSSAPPAGAAFGELPAAAGKAKAYEAWRKDLARWVRQSCPLVILRAERFKLASRPDEPRAEFVARLTQAAREQRDLEVEKLRRRYADKFA